MSHAVYAPLGMMVMALMLYGLLLSPPHRFQRRGVEIDCEEKQPEMDVHPLNDRG